MYYLQSRYYDPSIGRFINADEFVSTGQGLLGFNMFTYCLNNPVNRVDHDGRRSTNNCPWRGTSGSWLPPGFPQPGRGAQSSGSSGSGLAAGRGPTREAAAYYQRQRNQQVLAAGQGPIRDIMDTTVSYVQKDFLARGLAGLLTLRRYGYASNPFLESAVASRTFYRRAIPIIGMTITFFYHIDQGESFINAVMWTGFDTALATGGSMILGRFLGFPGKIIGGALGIWFADTIRANPYICRHNARMW